MTDLLADPLLSLAAQALTADAPELPAEAIAAIARAAGTRRAAMLDVVRRKGSPLYVLETETLRSRAKRFTEAFGRAMPAPIRVYYAVKSNNHPEVAATLVEAGLGLDVSSGLEFDLALEVGARDIIFSGPGKTDQELAQAATYPDRVTVLLDSMGELRRLEAEAARQGDTIRAGARLTTTSHGLWRKFGINPADLAAFLTEAQTCRHVNLCGLQFHTSWNLSPDAQVAFIAALGSTLGDISADLRAGLEFVDLGGGYWPEQGEWLQAAGTAGGSIRTLLDADSLDVRRRYRLPAVGIEQFADQLGRAVTDHLLPLGKFTICFEPGRWLCNDAMHVLMTVVDRKAPDLVIVDAGTNSIGWERFEMDFAPIINLTRPAVKEIRCDVHGCLCTPHDLWGYAIWGDGAEPGDVLLVPYQGAYTYSLRQEFIKPLPRVIVCDTGSLAAAERL